MLTVVGENIKKYAVMAASAASDKMMGEDCDLAWVWCEGGQLWVRGARQSHIIACGVPYEGDAMTGMCAVKASALVNALGVVGDAVKVSRTDKQLILDGGRSRSKLSLYDPNMLPHIEDAPSINGPKVRFGDLADAIRAVLGHAAKDSAKSGAAEVSRAVHIKGGQVLATSGTCCGVADLPVEDLGEWSIGTEAAVALTKLDIPGDTMLTVRVEVGGGGGWAAITWAGGSFSFRPRQGCGAAVWQVMSMTQHSEQWLSLGAAGALAASQISGRLFEAGGQVEARLAADGDSIATLSAATVTGEVEHDIEAASADRWSVTLNPRLLRECLVTLAKRTTSADVMLSVVRQGFALLMTNAEGSARCLLALIQK